LLNFVPNIGSILAAIPPVLLALVGPASGSGLETEAAAELGMMAQPEIRALITALGFVAINCFISYAIEPQFMGKGLGLSTLVVFLSLVFWGWVLGPTGMLLSAPLTMSVHIALRNYDQTHWIATLMGSKAPKVTHA
jgi:predicted PurR-regulated permease PerM